MPSCTRVVLKKKKEKAGVGSGVVVGRQMVKSATN